MKKRRYPLRLFFIGFMMNLLAHFFWLFIPGIVLLIVGIWVPWSLYAGLALLGIDIIASFIEQMGIRRAMLTESDNEQFRKFQDAVTLGDDPFAAIKNFVEGAVEENKQQNNFVVDLCAAICKKCEYGDAIEKLNEHERVFYITQTLEQEVNNGGFSQYFYNSSGDFSNELVDAFTKIGALKTADICKKALAVFEGIVPTDRDERDALLNSLDCDEIWDACDDAFYEYEDDLTALNYAYIMQHRDSFS